MSTPGPSEEGFSALDEIAAPAPDQGSGQSTENFESRDTSNGSKDDGDRESEFESEEANALDELAAPAPEQNVDERSVYWHQSLENERHRDPMHKTRSSETTKPNQAKDIRQERLARIVSEFYVTSYLIFFSIFGVLARLGILALTDYHGAPVASTVLWANVGGSLIMGFLREDRMLFRSHYRKALSEAQDKQEMELSNDSSGPGDSHSTVETAAMKAFSEKKRTLRIFIGLTVGFCGSFTSFSEIIRDVFLALSNDLDTAGTSSQKTIAAPSGRPDGYSVCAVLAIFWLQVSMSIAALQFGAHLANGLLKLERMVPDSLDLNAEKVAHFVAIPLAWGTWLGAVLLTIWPPHDAWRGKVLFSIVFAPLGCLLRFYLALALNRRIASFPLGTFTANVFGTAVLGMAWDLQHAQFGGLIGCQVLQGVMDGFSGALTTVSTWVLELKTLRTMHAYIYGSASLLVSFAFMAIIMGSLRWTQGFLMPVCGSA